MVSIRTESALSSAGSLRQKSQPTDVIRCRRKFLRYFPKGFYDHKYEDWERGYKWAAHERWMEVLNKREFSSLLRKAEYIEIALRAVKIESPTNLLFSFEKMALRDSVRETAGAKIFAEGLYRFLHGKGEPRRKFERWCEAVESLPVKQSRVFTHPVATVFGFIAQPEDHIFLKPTVNRNAAQKYGFDFKYNSRPGWEVYSNLLEFAQQIRRDLKDLKPLDMIDIQSFIWVQGSSEYP